MIDRVLGAAGLCLAAGEVVERRRVAGRSRACCDPARSRPRSRRPRRRDGTRPTPPSRLPRRAFRPCSRPRAPSSRPPPRRPSGSFPVRRTRALPAGASTVSPPISNRARPRRTTYSSSTPSSSACSGMSRSPGFGGRPRVRPERSDPQVVAYRPHVRVLPVGNVLQLIDCRNAIAHGVSTPSRPMDGRRRPVDVLSVDLDRDPILKDPRSGRHVNRSGPLRQGCRGRAAWPACASGRASRRRSRASAGRRADATRTRPRSGWRAGRP